MDFDNYFDRIKSFFGIEVEGAFEKAARPVFTAQELARQHPEFDRTISSTMLIPAVPLTGT